MSSTFSNDEKTNLLFKKLKGKPSTLNEREYFQEPNRPGRIRIQPHLQIWTQSALIPSTAPVSLSALTESSLDDNGRPMKGSFAGKTDGVVRRYIKVPLTMVVGTADKAYEAEDASTSHPGGFGDVAGTDSKDLGVAGSFGRVLQDTIPFNQDEPTGTYEFQLYKSTVSEAQIPFGALGAHWELDPEAGIVTFYEFAVISNVSESQAPLVSFYRYIGAFGLGTTTSASGTTSVFQGGIQTGGIQCPTDLAVGTFLQGVQIGTTCDGAWRTAVNGGGNDDAETEFHVQQRVAGQWITKARLRG